MKHCLERHAIASPSNNCNVTDRLKELIRVNYTEANERRTGVSHLSRTTDNVRR
jgi:hypothetical protein